MHFRVSQLFDHLLLLGRAGALYQFAQRGDGTEHGQAIVRLSVRPERHPVV